MIIANLEQFTSKNKPIIYTRIFFEFYNWKNRKQVYEIYIMIEFEKRYTLIANNLRNLDIYQIIKIFSVLQNIYIMPRNKNKVVFYINNYIN